MAIFEVTHTTEFEYKKNVVRSYNLTHLKPLNDDYQTCHTNRVEVFPEPSYRAPLTDYYGNSGEYFIVHRHHRKLVVNGISRVETWGPGPNASPALTCGEARERLAVEGGHTELTEYMYPTEWTLADPTMAARAAGFYHPGKPLVRLAEEISQFIYREFAYAPGETTVETRARDAWKIQKGVCQDFAQVGLAFLRSLGFPARYVCGYIETARPGEGPGLTGSDESHAWFSVYVPGTGWLDFDPTNNKRRDDQYIATAVGRDYRDTTPTRGVIFGGDSNKMKASVTVRRLADGEAGFAPG